MFTLFKLIAFPKIVKYITITFFHYVLFNNYFHKGLLNFQLSVFKNLNVTCFDFVNQPKRVVLIQTFLNFKKSMKGINEVMRLNYPV